MLNEILNKILNKMNVYFSNYASC